MAIDEDTQAKILRYHHVEKWGPHTIAKQLGIHHSVVERVLSQAGMPRPMRTQRPSMIDPYVPFILETLNKYPSLTASRLYAMAQERGYPGGPTVFRQRIAELRPKPPAEAYLRLKTLPGEQAQVDWGHFGYLQIGKARRPLMGFVMVLSFSRKIFLKFYLNQRMESFIRGHVDAFTQWQGVPKVLLYDNLKSAVLERQGDAIRFHPMLLSLAGHYRYEPRPVAVARGNEKGRVERAIRYIRGSFMAGRKYKGVEDLNQQALGWCNHFSTQRRCPEDKEKTVAQVFEQEQPALIQLPEHPFETQERVSVSISKTPYARFDGNDYSVPHTYVRKKLTLLATEHQVRILDNDKVIAQHTRSYDKGKQVEDVQHIEALAVHKKKAKYSRGQNRLSHAAPCSDKFLERLAQQGDYLAGAIKHLTRLLDEYGSQELEHALAKVLDQQYVHVNAVQQVLQTRREKRDQPPPIPIAMTHEKAKNILVRPASLKGYDQLTELNDE